MRGMNENSPDFNFGVVSFIFDGNKLQHRTAKERLVSTVRGARRIKDVSLRHCSLEDDGVQYVFSDLLDRNTLEKLDLSENNITDRGIAEICDYIGFNPKTTLSSINFS